MKRIALFFFTVSALVVGCTNMPLNGAQKFKAYPNPYNPATGVLTIENLDGSDFSTTQNDFVVYDFALNEVYRANLLPISGNKKLVWSGIDNAGIKVSPGIYYLKVIVTTASGGSNTDSMYKLIVQ